MLAEGAFDDPGPQAVFGLHVTHRHRVGSIGYTEKGAIASMITGFLCVPIFTFVLPNVNVTGEASDYFTQLSELPPSFTLALLAGVVVSLLSPDRKGALG